MRCQALAGYLILDDLINHRFIRNPASSNQKKIA